MEAQPADGAHPGRFRDARPGHRSRPRRSLGRLRAGLAHRRPGAIRVQRAVGEDGRACAGVAALSARGLLRLQRHRAQAGRHHARAVAGAGRRPRRFPGSARPPAGPQQVGHGPGRRALHRHAFQLLPAALHVEAQRPDLDVVHDLLGGRQRRGRSFGGEPHRPASVLQRHQPEKDSGGCDRRRGGIDRRDADRRLAGARAVPAARDRARIPHRDERRGGGPRRVADEANRRGQGFVAPDSRPRRRARPDRLDPVSADPRLFLSVDVPPALMRRLNVAVLGATGSIGRQTLDVIDRNPERFKLFGLTEGVRSANRQAEHVVQGRAGDPDFDARVEEMVTDPLCDIVVVAIPSARALVATLAALRAGKEIALATKEVLVMGGALVMRAAGERGIRPIDSEHSAIWQCLWGERRESVRRIVLTASGGPFWARSELDLDSVTVEQALNHPRWSMGPKVTVDSATLMNKGLELVEAHHLYRIPLDRVTVVIHPQSIVHSMVEFVDGSLKAQLGRPDMRLPIAVALAYPDRLPDAVPPTSIQDLSKLEFYDLDERRFPAVKLAREAARAGGGRPAVLNASNESGVNAFLAGELSFGRIVPAVEAALNAFPGGGESLEDVLEADRWARDFVANSRTLKAT